MIQIGIGRSPRSALLLSCALAPSALFAQTAPERLPSGQPAGPLAARG